MRVSVSTTLALVVIGITGSSAQQSALSDAAVRDAIVSDSRASYYRAGHPCACPEDLARNGSRCGARSAHDRPGGATPLCYASEVTADMVARYRARPAR
jgi:hypothetical protein